MSPISGRRAITNDFIIFATRALLCAMIAPIAGCGDKSEKPASAKAAANADADAPSRSASAGDVVKSAKPTANSKSPAEQKTSDAAKPKTTPPAEVDNTPRKPATVEE